MLFRLLFREGFYMAEALGFPPSALSVQKKSLSRSSSLVRAIEQFVGPERGSRIFRRKTWLWPRCSRAGNSALGSDSLLRKQLEQKKLYGGTV